MFGTGGQRFVTGLENSFGQCCFTSTEIVKTIRDRGPRTSTSSFTPFVSSDCLESVLFFLSFFFFLKTLTPSCPPLPPPPLRHSHSPSPLQSTGGDMPGTRDQSFVASLKCFFWGPVYPSFSHRLFFCSL